MRRFDLLTTAASTSHEIAEARRAVAAATASGPDCTECPMTAAIAAMARPRSAGSARLRTRSRLPVRSTATKTAKLAPSAMPAPSGSALRHEGQTEPDQHHDLNADAD